jgi:ribosomal protein S8
MERFEYALCNPNASLFNRMLTECLESEGYVESFKTKGPQYSAESLFVALIYHQQKTISKLIESLKSIKIRKCKIQE